jgi:hypothetical protein
MKTLVLAFALLFVGHPLSSWARSPVVVEHAGEDTLGQRLAYELREVIRASQSMRLVTTAEADPRIVVYLVTIDTSRSSPGSSTSAAMSVAYDSDALQLRGYLLTTVVLTCGSQRIQECAKDLAASVDEQLEEVRRDWPALWKNLKQ